MMELLDKYYPGDKVKITHSIWPTSFKPPGGEVTLAYRLRPEMDPVRVGLHVDVEYYDQAGTRMHRAEGFSGIITITEAEGLRFDIQMILMYVVLGIVGLAAIPSLQKAFFPSKKP